MNSVSRHTPKAHIAVRNERNIEFFMVSNAIIDEWAARLTHATFKVYVGLCRYADGNEASISYKALCARLAMSSSSVARALQQLEGQDLIRVEHHKDSQGVALNTYVLLTVPVTSMSEVTPAGDFDDESHPTSMSEVTLLRSSKCVLKTGEIKDEELKEVPAVVLRIRERDAKRLGGKR